MQLTVSNFTLGKLKAILLEIDENEWLHWTCGGYDVHLEISGKNYISGENYFCSTDKISKCLLAVNIIQKLPILRLT